MEYKWRTGRYCVFKNFVHLVFVTKYRKGVFTNAMLLNLEKNFKETCESLGGELLQFGGEADHVHLMVSVPPKVALCNFVGRLKGASSYTIRKKYKAILLQKLWGNHLWSPSYCVVSCGGAPLDIVREYIKKQSIPPAEKSVRQSLQEKNRRGEQSRVRIGKKARS